MDLQKILDSDNKEDVVNYVNTLGDSGEFDLLETIGEYIEPDSKDPYLFIEAVTNADLVDEEYRLVLLQYLIERNLTKSIEVYLPLIEFTNDDFIELMSLLTLTEEECDRSYYDWLESYDINYEVILPLLVKGLTEKINSETLIEVALKDLKGYWKVFREYEGETDWIHLSAVAEYIDKRKNL